MEEQYHPQSIEKKAQQFWDENQTFCAKTQDSTQEQERFYCLSMFPYPSGDLHMGHIRNYTIGDVIARYQWLQGKQVLHPIGWDAFGLPAENAAIANQSAPAVWTDQNIARMRAQFKQMGYSFDWSREIRTCDPQYYRWEQWLFIQLYRQGLVYKKNAIVNWDPVDHTVLANEQVVDGRGWRSGALVERREIPQWFIKITAYADELLNEIDHLSGWPERVRTMQRNWIGRSSGLNIHFNIENHPHPLTVFTTRADTLFGVAYIAIAPEHPLAQEAAKTDVKAKTFIEKTSHTKMAEAEIATQEKEGVLLNFFAIHPITQKKLPIFIANFVLMQYGSGAIMAVPAHDERDFEFAQKYGIQFSPVIIPNANTQNWDFSKAAYTEEGILINSELFNGLNSVIAKQNISELLISQKLATSQVNYRLRDWGISRQRYWGTPIPIINCPACGDVLVSEQDLPVILPENLIPKGTGSPLKTTPEFYQTTCPKCGQDAHRETDTMDTFVESSWYYARFCCVDQNDKMLDERADYWMPVNQYIGGVEHAILHLLYARFIHKLLRDLKLVHSNEPFLNLLTQGMVLKDGHKMSKSKGNVVAPQALVDHYGADTVRLFIIFAAPPEQGLEWSDHGVEGASRFLKKLWQFAYALKLKINQRDDSPHQNFSSHEDLNSLDPSLQNTYQQIHQILQQATADMERQQYNTVASAAMKLLNVLNKMEEITTPETLFVLQEGTRILLRILSPITPHICHFLWKELAFGEDILQAKWPKVNHAALESQQVKMIIQINGKLRGQLLMQRNLEEKQVQALVLQENSIQHHISDKLIKKIIIVPNKLINIVI